MSFYDLTKDGILRPADLFKYRLKRDSSIPSRGGQKDFEPDGTWLQAKQLEALLQEKQSILSEPRVEKLKNLVEGLWDEEKRLVNLKKPGKFWMHMGFTDERRNWLYPEEALFLMETNTLEVYHAGRPMSIQEAYCKLLGRGMCQEEYQVFSHLRRLGFVVLRHEEERMFTDYERQINLNEYVDKKKRKERLKKGKGKSKKKINHSDTSVSASAENHKSEKDCENGLKNVYTSNSTNNTSLKSINQHMEKDQSNGTEDRLINSSDLASKRKLEEDMELEETCNKTPNLNNGQSETNSTKSDFYSTLSDESDSSFYNVSSWSTCFKKKITSDSLEVGEESTKKSSRNLNQTFLDADCVDLLPDMAQSNTTGLKLPPLHLLPTNLEVKAFDCDPAVDKLKNPALYKLSKASERSLKKEDYKEKRFSCLEKMKREPKIKAGSWSEYKRKKAERHAEMSSSSLVDHLWNDTVTPLLRPTEVTSYEDVISRLQIIQSADNDSLVPDISDLPTPTKVTFDVHLPDQRFKKSMPGVPDHRVCVSRCDGIPPGLTAIQHLWNKYKDGVPIHWAVVDSGEIAFYVFDNTSNVEVLSL